jgi:uncharacterized protein
MARMPDDLRIPATGGLELGAWFFRGREGRGPCVVMAHGFAGTRRTGLAPFAQRFQSAGLHVLAFDYRYFGDSGGEPRQLIAPKAQFEDWVSALAYARGRDDVDPDRVALWGVSYSGGQVVVVGARDGRVAAISSLVPMMDAQAVARDLVKREGAWWVVKGLARGVVDAIRGALGMRPILVPVVGPPGASAALTMPGVEASYLGIAGPDWVNAVCARVAVTGATFRPVTDVADVRCPLLVQIGDRDVVVPNDAAERAGSLAGERATVRHYPLDHFDVFQGPGFEQVVADEVDFFKRHLSSGASPSA